MVGGSVECGCIVEQGCGCGGCADVGRLVVVEGSRALASVVEGLCGGGGDGGMLGELDVVGGCAESDRGGGRSGGRSVVEEVVSCVGDAVVVGGEVVAAVGSFAEL